MISMTLRVYRGKTAVPGAKFEWTDGFDPDWAGDDGVAHLQWADREAGREVGVYCNGKYLGTITVKEGANPWFKL